MAKKKNEYTGPDIAGQILSSPTYNVNQSEEESKPGFFADLFGNFPEFVKANYNNYMMLKNETEENKLLQSLRPEKATYTSEDEYNAIVDKLETARAEKEQYKNAWGNSYDKLHAQDSLYKYGTQGGGTIESMVSTAVPSAVGSVIGGAGGAIIGAPAGPIGATVAGAAGATIGSTLLSLPAMYEATKVDVAHNAAEGREKTYNAAIKKGLSQEEATRLAWETSDQIEDENLTAKLLYNIGPELLLNLATRGMITRQLAQIIGKTRAARVITNAITNSKLGNATLSAGRGAVKTANVITGFPDAIANGIANKAVRAGMPAGASVWAGRLAGAGALGAANIVNEWNDEGPIDERIIGKAVNARMAKIDPSKAVPESEFDYFNWLKKNNPVTATNPDIQNLYKEVAFSTGLMTLPALLGFKGSVNMKAYRFQKAVKDYLDDPNHNPMSPEMLNALKVQIAALKDIPLEETASWDEQTTARMYRETVPNFTGVGATSEDLGTEANFMDLVSGDKNNIHWSNKALGQAGWDYLQRAGKLDQAVKEGFYNETERQAMEEQSKVTTSETNNPESLRVDGEKLLRELFNSGAETTTDSKVTTDASPVVENAEGLTVRGPSFKGHTGLEKERYKESLGVWGRLDTEDTLSEAVASGRGVVYFDPNTNREVTIREGDDGTFNVSEEGASGELVFNNMNEVETFLNGGAKFMEGSDSTLTKEDARNGVDKIVNLTGTADGTIYGTRVNTLEDLVNYYNSTKGTKNEMSPARFYALSNMLLKAQSGGIANKISFDMAPNVRAVNTQGNKVLGFQENIQEESTQKALLHLFSGGDLATAVHEIGHVAWSMLSEEQRAVYRAYAKKSLRTFVCSILGLKPDSVTDKELFTGVVDEAGKPVLNERNGELLLQLQDKYAKIAFDLGVEAVVRQSINSPEERFCHEMSVWYTEGIAKGKKPKNMIQHLLNTMCSSLGNVIGALDNLDERLHGEGLQQTLGRDLIEGEQSPLTLYNNVNKMAEPSFGSAASELITEVTGKNDTGSTNENSERVETAPVVENGLPEESSDEEKTQEQIVQEELNKAAEEEAASSASTATSEVKPEVKAEAKAEEKVDEAKRDERIKELSEKHKDYMEAEKGEEVDSIWERKTEEERKEIDELLRLLRDRKVAESKKKAAAEKAETESKVTNEEATKDESGSENTLNGETSLFDVGDVAKGKEVKVEEKTEAKEEASKTKKMTKEEYASYKDDYKGILDLVKEGNTAEAIKAYDNMSPEEQERFKNGFEQWNKNQKKRSFDFVKYVKYKEKFSNILDAVLNNDNKSTELWSKLSEEDKKEFEEGYGQWEEQNKEELSQRAIEKLSNEQAARVVGKINRAMNGERASKRWSKKNGKFQEGGAIENYQKNKPIYRALESAFANNDKAAVDNIIRAMTPEQREGYVEHLAHPSMADKAMNFMEGSDRVEKYKETLDNFKKRWEAAPVMQIVETPDNDVSRGMVFFLMRFMDFINNNSKLTATRGEVSQKVEYGAPLNEQESLLASIMLGNIDKNGNFTNDPDKNVLRNKELSDRKPNERLNSFRSMVVIIQRFRALELLALKNGIKDFREAVFNAPYSADWLKNADAIGMFKCFMSKGYHDTLTATGRKNAIIFDPQFMGEGSGKKYKEYSVTTQKSDATKEDKKKIDEMIDTLENNCDLAYSHALSLELKDVQNMSRTELTKRLIACLYRGSKEEQEEKRIKLKNDISLAYHRYLRAVNMLSPDLQGQVKAVLSKRRNKAKGKSKFVQVDSFQPGVYIRYKKDGRVYLMDAVTKDKETGVWYGTPYAGWRWQLHTRLGVAAQKPQIYDSPSDSCWPVTKSINGKSCQVMTVGKGKYNNKDSKHEFDLSELKKGELGDTRDIPLESNRKRGVYGNAVSSLDALLSDDVLRNSSSKTTASRRSSITFDEEDESLEGLLSSASLSESTTSPKSTTKSTRAPKKTSKETYYNSDEAEEESGRATISFSEDYGDTGYTEVVNNDEAETNEETEETYTENDTEEESEQLEAMDEDPSPEMTKEQLEAYVRDYEGPITNKTKDKFIEMVDLVENIKQDAEFIKSNDSSMLDEFRKSYSDNVRKYRTLWVSLTKEQREYWGSNGDGVEWARYLQHEKRKKIAETYIREGKYKTETVEDEVAEETEDNENTGDVVENNTGMTEEEMENRAFERMFGAGSSNLGLFQEGSVKMKKAMGWEERLGIEHIIGENTEKKIARRIKRESKEEVREEIFNNRKEGERAISDYYGNIERAEGNFMEGSENHIRGVASAEIEKFIKENVPAYKEELWTKLTGRILNDIVWGKSEKEQKEDASDIRTEILSQATEEECKKEHKIYLAILERQLKALFYSMCNMKASGALYNNIFNRLPVNMKKQFIEYKKDFNSLYFRARVKNGKEIPGPKIRKGKPPKKIRIGFKIFNINGSGVVTQEIIVANGEDVGYYKVNPDGTRVDDIYRPIKHETREELAVKAEKKEAREKAKEEKDNEAYAVIIAEEINNTKRYKGTKRTPFTSYWYSAAENGNERAKKVVKMAEEFAVDFYEQGKSLINTIEKIKSKINDLEKQRNNIFRKIELAKEFDEIVGNYPVMEKLTQDSLPQDVEEMARELGLLPEETMPKIVPTARDLYKNKEARGYVENLRRKLAEARDFGNRKEENRIKNKIEEFLSTLKYNNRVIKYRGVYGDKFVPAAERKLGELYRTIEGLRKEMKKSQKKLNLFETIRAKRDNGSYLNSLSSKVVDKNNISELLGSRDILKRMVADETLTFEVTENTIKGLDGGGEKLTEEEIAFITGLKSGIFSPENIRQSIKDKDIEGVLWQVMRLQRDVEAYYETHGRVQSYIRNKVRIKYLLKDIARSLAFEKGVTMKEAQEEYLKDIFDNTDKYIKEAEDSLKELHKKMDINIGDHKETYEKINGIEVLDMDDKLLRENEEQLLEMEFEIGDDLVKVEDTELRIDRLIELRERIATDKNTKRRTTSEAKSGSYITRGRLLATIVKGVNKEIYKAEKDGMNFMEAGSGGIQNRAIEEISSRQKVTPQVALQMYHRALNEGLVENLVDNNSVPFFRNFAKALMMYKGEKRNRNMKVSMDKIKRETGFYVGPDGKWRTSLADNLYRMDLDKLGVNILGSGYNSPILLREVWKNDILYKMYPELKNTKLEVVDGEYGVSLDLGSNVIKIGSHEMEKNNGVKGYIKKIAELGKSGKSVEEVTKEVFSKGNLPLEAQVLGQIQKIIAEREGFSMGVGERQGEFIRKLSDERNQVWRGFIDNLIKKVVQLYNKGKTGSRFNLNNQISIRNYTGDPYKTLHHAADNRSAKRATEDLIYEAFRCVLNDRDEGAMKNEQISSLMDFVASIVNPTDNENSTALLVRLKRAGIEKDNPIYEALTNEDSIELERGLLEAHVNFIKTVKERLVTANKADKEDLSEELDEEITALQEETDPEIRNAIMLSIKAIDETLKKIELEEEFNPEYARQAMQTDLSPSAASITSLNNIFSEDIFANKDRVTFSRMYSTLAPYIKLVREALPKVVSDYEENGKSLSTLLGEAYKIGENEDDIVYGSLGNHNAWSKADTILRRAKRAQKEIKVSYSTTATKEEKADIEEKLRKLKDIETEMKEYRVNFDKANPTEIENMIRDSAKAEAYMDNNGLAPKSVRSYKGYVERLLKGRDERANTKEESNGNFMEGSENNKNNTKDETGLTPEQKRELKEYFNRWYIPKDGKDKEDMENRFGNFQEAGSRIDEQSNPDSHTADPMPDVNRVVFTATAKHGKVNRDKIRAFHNSKYWDVRQDADGSIVCERKGAKDFQNKTIRYNGITELKREDSKKNSSSKEILKSACDAITRRMFNILEPIANLARESGVWEAYEKLVVTKDQGSVALSAMKDGIVKEDGTRTMALNKIIEDVGYKDQNAFLEYAIAFRVIDLANRKSPIIQKMTVDEAKEIIDKVRNSANGAKWERLRKGLVEYNNELLKVLRDSGIITSEAYDRMVAGNPNYVPFFHKDETGEDMMQRIIRTQSLINARNPIRKIGNSVREIKNPLLKIQELTAEYYQRAAKNKAGQIFVNEIARAISVDEKGRKVRLNGALCKELVGENLKEDEKEMIFSVMVDGEQKFYQVSDRFVYEALKSFSPELMTEVGKMFHKVANGIASTQRNLATITPEFASSNWIRDNFEAFLTSKHGFIPFVDAIWGMQQMKKDSPWWQEYQRLNGEMFTRTMEGKEYAEAYGQKTLQGYLDTAKNEDLGVWERSKGGLGAFFFPLIKLYRVMEKMNNYVEIGTRVGEYKNARMGYEGLLGRMKSNAPTSLSNATRSEYHAAYESKDITLNFGQFGSWGKTLNHYTSFFNAGLQGCYKYLRTLQDAVAGTNGKGHQAELLFKMAAIAVLSMAVCNSGDGDDDFDEAPNWEWQQYWILPNGLRIPKDHIFGQTIGNTIEAIFRAESGKRRFSAMDWASIAVNELHPNSIIPALVSIYGVGLIGNVDTFRMQRIVPEYMEKKRGYQQVSLNTRQLSKDISKAIFSITGLDISAKKIDYWFQAQLSNTNKYIQGTYDFAKELFTGEAPKNKIMRVGDKEDKLADFMKEGVPFPLNPTTGRYVTNRTAYQTLIDFRQEYGDLKKIVDAGEAHDKKLWTKMDNANKQIMHFNKMLKGIRENPKMSDSQKKAQADAIYKQQIKVAKQAMGLRR